MRAGRLMLELIDEHVARGDLASERGFECEAILAGKLNFEAVYEPLVDAWALYDNSNGEPVLLSWGER